MIDVDKSELYITKLHRVVRGGIKRRKLPTGAPREHDGFVFIMRGECRYFFPKEERTFTASQGEILYLAANSEYEMHILSDRYDFIFADFDFDDKAPKRSTSFAISDAHAESYFTKMKARLESGNSAKAMELMYRIYATVTHDEQYLKPTARGLVEKAAAYVREHYADPDLSVQKLSDKANVSACYFRRLFTASFGVPPSKFITSVRVAKAKELMLCALYSLPQIAELVGFSSAPHLCKVFKSETGYTPNKWLMQALKP